LTKKERIAIVISIVYFIQAFTLGTNDTDVMEGLFLGLVPLSLYWGYRFIQNDISFLKMKDEN